MVFAKKVWRFLMGVKDALALLFLLLFFGALFTALSSRPGPGQVRDGALLLKLDGAVVEEPAKVDAFAALTGGGMPMKQYRTRDLVTALDAAAKDDRIKAVVLDLGRFAGGSQVSLFEVAEAMDRVRAAKKPVLAWGFAYVDDGLLLAAHVSEAWVDPMGGGFIAGPGGNGVYFGKLLERFKVTPHIYRVGTYKEYVEPYVRNEMSPEARAARSQVFGALFSQWKENVVKARPKANVELVSKDPVNWLKASGNDLAEATKAAGLVDRIGDKITFGKRVAELVGEDKLDPKPGAYAHSTLKAYVAANKPPRHGKAIGVVTVAGDIVDGKDGPGKAGGDRIAELLDSAKAKDIAALVLRVDSPGGTVTGAERIRQAIERQKARGIPVVVSMANLAASGGYWVSTPARRIFAEPSTVTGSIGIFAVIPSFEKALAEYGVSSDGVRTTPLSGQPDLLGGFTPEVDALMQANIEHGYQRFIGLVAKSRGKTPEQVDAVAQGRIWDGGTARQIGLVDQFGGLDDALAYAAKEAKLSDGDWHALYLGEDEGMKDPFLASLLSQGEDDEDAAPAESGDMFAILARGQQQLLARAMADAQRLFTVSGMQAYCLDCAGEPATQPGAEMRGPALPWWAQLLALRR